MDVGADDMGCQAGFEHPAGDVEVEVQAMADVEQNSRLDGSVKRLAGHAVGTEHPVGHAAERVPQHIAGTGVGEDGVHGRVRVGPVLLVHREQLSGVDVQGQTGELSGLAGERQRPVAPSREPAGLGVGLDAEDLVGMSGVHGDDCLDAGEIRIEDRRAAASALDRSDQHDVDEGDDIGRCRLHDVRPQPGKAPRARTTHVDGRGDTRLDADLVGVQGEVRGPFVNVGVEIDQAGQDQMAVDVHHLGSRRRFELRAHGVDAIAGNSYVHHGVDAVGRVENPTATKDQIRHWLRTPIGGDTTWRSRAPARATCGNGTGSRLR